MLPVIEAFMTAHGLPDVTVVSDASMISEANQKEIEAAGLSYRQGARPLLWNTHRACRHVRLVWDEAGFTGKLAAWAASMKMTLQIVSRRHPHAFEVLPRRWVAGSWSGPSPGISKHRRTVRDYERLPASHEAMILWAMIALMTKRLAQTTQ